MLSDAPTVHVKLRIRATVEAHYSGEISTARNDSMTVFWDDEIKDYTLSPSAARIAPKRIFLSQERLLLLTIDMKNRFIPTMDFLPLVNHEAATVGRYFDAWKDNERAVFTKQPGLNVQKDLKTYHAPTTYTFHSVVFKPLKTSFSRGCKFFTNSIICFLQKKKCMMRVNRSRK